MESSAVRFPAPGERIRPAACFIFNMNGLSPAVVLALEALHYLLRKQAPAEPKEFRRAANRDRTLLRGVMKRLREAGLVHYDGRRYRPAKAPGDMSVLDVVRAVDAPRRPEAPCHGDYEACDSRATCILSPLCRKAGAAFEGSLREFTLADLADVAVDLPNCLDPRLRNRTS